MRFIASVTGLLLFFAPVAQAQNQIIQYFRVQSGTGFFVNREQVITNAHVVKGCDKVTVKGAIPEHDAKVEVLDEQNDLALLQTNSQPAQFAPLRFNIDALKAGDKVLVVGYPGEAGARGEYHVATAQVQEVHNLAGMEGRFFITDVVEHGNSGGPVFDTSGNVIGVVVAKSVLYTVNAMTQQHISEQHVGVAISLATLKQFLYNHGVYTEWIGSNLLYADNYIEEHAKGYIVNVQCRTPASAADAQLPEVQAPQAVVPIGGMQQGGMQGGMMPQQR